MTIHALSVCLLALISVVKCELSQEDLSTPSTSNDSLPNMYLEQMWRGNLTVQDKDVLSVEITSDSKNVTETPHKQLFEPAKHANWGLLEHKECGTSASDRIIGGKEAHIGAYPWIARIGYIRNKDDIPLFRCGAVLVSKFYLVTAAHCVTNLPNKLKVAIVRLGEHNTSTDPDCKSGYCYDPVEDYKPANLIVHKDYGKPQFKNDIALVRTDREVQFTESIAPICAISGPLMNKTYVGEFAQVAGWGIVDIEEPKQSVTLQTIKLPIVHNDKCVVAFQHYADIGDTQMCVGGDIGQDSCGGDSGGPLMMPDHLEGSAKYFLIGVVSFGAKRCGATTMPGVYTRVSSFMQWILDNIHA